MHLQIGWKRRLGGGSVSYESGLMFGRSELSTNISSAVVKDMIRTCSAFTHPAGKSLSVGLGCCDEHARWWRK